MNQWICSKTSQVKHCFSHTCERACSAGALSKQTVHVVTDFGLHADVRTGDCTDPRGHGWMTIYTSCIPEQTLVDTQTRKVWIGLNRFRPPTTRDSTQNWNLPQPNMTLELTNMADYLVASLVSQVSYPVQPLQQQFRSNSSPYYFDCGLFYGTRCINTHAVNKLVLHLSGPSLFMLRVFYRRHGFVCCASIFSQLASWLAVVPFHMSACSAVLCVAPNNRISNREYWTCSISTISNWDSPNCLLSRSFREKSLLTHLTLQENVAR